MKAKTRAKGQRGEAIAATALEKAGYAIIERNWRCTLGELDLIASHRGDLVFVEVRARYDGADAALESITARKRGKLMNLALTYLAEHDIDDATFRIDIVAVDFSAGPSVEIIENAVGW